MSVQRRPPFLAVRLLHTLLPDELREHVLGDLLERFHDSQGDARTARRWFWCETIAALLSLRGLESRTTSPLATGDPLMIAFLDELRYAIRTLRRAPAFTLLCVAVLGIGIGATATIVSIVGPVLVRALPYTAPDRLGFIWQRGTDGSRGNVGWLTFTDLARESRSIERAAAVGSWQPTLTGTGTGDAEIVQGERVTSDYFRVLGVTPALGRDFTAEDDQPGRSSIVILTDGLWRRRYGADPALVGRSIQIGGTAMTVAGVLPASFENVISPASEIFRALGYGPELPFACRTCQHLRVVARLKPGITFASAQAEIDQVMSRIVQQFPKEYAASGTLLVPMQEQVTLAVRPVLLAVFGAVVLVLLIALANVSNLQLARASRRDGEFAIRVALGAGRARLARQLLAEGLVLAVLAAIAGVALAAIAVPLLVAQLPSNLPRISAMHLDWRTLATLGAVTLFIGIIVGIVPALGSARDAADRLRGRSRGMLGVRDGARAGIVVSEFALAIMLLAGAGLVARSLERLLSVNAGFDATHLLTLMVNSVGAAYREDAAVIAFHDRVREAVRAIPGVIDVGTASQLPLGGNMDRYGVNAEDKPLANPELAPSADRYVVSPDYLHAMRIPLLAGRTLTAADRDSSPKVAVVSASLAKRIWPGESALGKRIHVGGIDSPARTIVGVVGDVRHAGLDEIERQQLYVTERQWFFTDNSVAMVVRTASDPTAMAATIRKAVLALDPAQPVTAIASMDQVIASSTAQRRLALAAFGAFALVALLLAAAGIYGVLAGSVAERTREIGLRSALGAAPRSILGLVVRRALVLAAAGSVIGLAGAVAGTRFLRALLYEVGATDPLTLGGVVLVLAAVTLAACIVPAVRALRIDPMAALRSD